jgi:hypothetical protein
MTFAVPQQIEDDDLQQSFPQLSLPIVQIQNAPRYSFDKDASSSALLVYYIAVYWNVNKKFHIFSKIFPAVWFNGYFAVFELRKGSKSRKTLNSSCCGKHGLTVSPLRKQGSRVKKLDSRFRGNDKHCSRSSS